LPIELYIKAISEDKYSLLGSANPAFNKYFADSSKRWLTGVKDNNAFFPTNWVRSGDYSPECDETDPAFEGLPNGPTYLNPCNYPDEAGADPTQGYERVLEGIIAPHRLVGYQADYMPMAYFGTFSGSSKLNASISFLPSVNIVLTKDTTLWTRCPIVELGRNSALNVGAAQPGALRKSPSVFRNGQPDGTGTGMGFRRSLRGPSPERADARAGLGSSMATATAVAIGGSSR
jgi:hypothetical protein